MNSKQWQKNLKKYWKIWLLSLLMALTLMARGAASFTRSRRSAAASTRPAATITAEATGESPSPAASNEPLSSSSGTADISHLAIQPQYDLASNFSENLAAVRVGSQWGYITR